MNIDRLNENGKIWIQKRINQQKQKQIEISQDTVDLIIDWFNYSIEHIHNFDKKFYKITWDEAIKAQEKWHKTFHKKKRHIVDDENTKFVYQCSKDYAIYQILTQDGLDYESAQMNHCVQTYSLKRYDIYSLRDQKNNSHMTIAFYNHDNKIHQIKLKNNRTMTVDYLNIIFNWLSQKTKLKDIIKDLDLNNIVTLLDNKIKEQDANSDFEIEDQSLILNNVISESSYLKNTSYKYNDLTCFLKKEDKEISISANKLNLKTSNKKIKLTLSDCENFQINPNVFDVFDITLINCRGIEIPFHFPVKNIKINLINSYVKFSFNGNYCLNNIDIERDETSIVDLCFINCNIQKKYYFNINGEMKFIDCNVDLSCLDHIETFSCIFEKSKISCKKQNILYKTCKLSMSDCNVKNLHVIIDANTIDFNDMDFYNTCIKPITNILTLNKCKNINKHLCCFYKRQKYIKIKNHDEDIDLSYFDCNRIQLEDSQISVKNFTPKTNIYFTKCFVNILNDNKLLETGELTFDKSKVIFKNIVDVRVNIFWIIDTNISLKNLYCKDTLCFCFHNDEESINNRVSFNTIHCDGIIYIVDTKRWVYKGEDDKKNGEIHNEYNIKDYFHYDKISCDKLFCSDWDNIIPYSDIIKTKNNHFIWHNDKNTKKIGYFKDAFIKHFEIDKHIKTLHVKEYLIHNHKNIINIKSKKTRMELNENFYNLNNKDVKYKFNCDTLVFIYSGLIENCQKNININDFYDLKFKHFFETYNDYFNHEKQSIYNPKIILPINKKEKVTKQNVCQLTKRE